MLCEHGNVHPCFDCDVAPADQEIQSLRRMLEQAQARVAELETELAQAVPEWIKCSDRLPSGYQTVLVASSTGSIYTCTKSVIERKNSEPDSPQFRRERFTHWMPLPKPPQEGEGDE